MLTGITEGVGVQGAEAQQLLVCGVQQKAQELLRVLLLPRGRRGRRSCRARRLACRTSRARISARGAVVLVMMTTSTWFSTMTIACCILCLHACRLLQEASAACPACNLTMELGTSAGRHDP